MSVLLLFVADIVQPSREVSVFLFVADVLQPSREVSVSVFVLFVADILQPCTATVSAVPALPGLAGGRPQACRLDGARVLLLENQPA